MKIRELSLLVLLASGAVALFWPVLGASDTDSAQMQGIPALAISHDAGSGALEFFPAMAGSAAETVVPTPFGTPSTTQFDVTGNPNTSYAIFLPGAIQLITGDGSTADKQIQVDDFRAYSSGAASETTSFGILDGSGFDRLTIGATRQALSANQVLGEYDGTFTITVAY